eukprot:5694387-Pleurochrysis_carterae.AAC.1
MGEELAASKPRRMRRLVHVDGTCRGRVGTQLRIRRQHDVNVFKTLALVGLLTVIAVSTSASRPAFIIFAAAV